MIEARLEFLAKMMEYHMVEIEKIRHEMEGLSNAPMRDVRQRD